MFAVRPGSRTRYTATEMDRHVKLGIRWVKAHAAEHAIDPARIGLTGASAGGHLAALASLTPEDGAPDAKDPLARHSTRVRAVGVFFPPTDFLDWKDGQRGDLKVLGSLLFVDGVEGHSEAEIAERAFAERPDDPRSRLALVRARVAQGRAEEALPHLAFLQAAPIGDEERSAIVAVSADVWAGVGQAQLSRGEYDRAIRSFESSLLVTERAPLRASLGEARRRAGTTTSAPGPRRMKRRARVSRCGPTCSIPSSPRASRRTDRKSTRLNSSHSSVSRMPSSA